MKTLSASHDDLELPDFLNRKLHPELNVREPVAARKIRSDAVTEIVVPTTKTKPVERDYGQLSAGEREELLDIKAMVKTNLVLAKRMASEWIQRSAVPETQARRRHHLKSIKGLHARGASTRRSKLRPATKVKFSWDKEAG